MCEFAIFGVDSVIWLQLWMDKGNGNMSEGDFFCILFGLAFFLLPLLLFLFAFFLFLLFLAGQLNH